MIITLIGYRGTGKSTVAKRLAKLLGWDSIDADVALEARVGKSIALIFAEDGESVFRDHESAVLRDLVRKRKCVMASGGGVILRRANCELIRNAGKTVWLTAAPETIYQRLGGDKTTQTRRPDLTDQGGLGEIESVLHKREPLYRKLADLVVGTENRTPDEIAAAIATEFATWTNSTPD